MSLKKPDIYTSLLPLSLIYGFIVKVRNKLFDYGILKSNSFDTPIICVGNISVGGTGKTPHTEYLIRLLEKEYEVNVLSRGYKRKSKGFVIAEDDKTGINDIGDEPFQMWTKFPGIKVAVDGNRCRGICNLLKLNATGEKEKVIILDDAFQHRYVKAGMNILLIDYNRPIHNDAVLPAGRLREQEGGKKRADIIIISKCPENMTMGEKNEFITAVSPTISQEVFFTGIKYDDLYNIFDHGRIIRLEDIGRGYDIMLMTGIASPKAMVELLGKHCDRLTTMTFSDHHNFSKEDMARISRKFKSIESRKKIIVTTEKDAARLINDNNLDDDIKQYIFALPVKVYFLDNAEQKFNQKITEYVRKNSRNSSLS